MYTLRIINMLVELQHKNKTEKNQEMSDSLRSNHNNRYKF